MTTPLESGSIFSCLISKLYRSEVGPSIVFVLKLSSNPHKRNLHNSVFLAVCANMIMIVSCKTISSCSDIKHKEVNSGLTRANKFMHLINIYHNTPWTPQHMHVVSFGVVLLCLYGLSSCGYCYMLFTVRIVSSLHVLCCVREILGPVSI